MSSVNDDDRHRAEQAARRAKRKASKSSHHGSEKDRKRREHAQRVLEEQNKKGKSKRSRTTSPHHLGSSSKKGKVVESSSSSNNFQSLFTQRAQGFRIDFSFRNAPPRPPVGPCFVGQGLEGQLQDLSSYRPLNAVEISYNWKLHAEQDLGVPIAPSAMDLSMYDAKKKNKNAMSTEETTNVEKLHPDDDALLNWQGPMGDTAAEDFQRSKDQARAAARLALAGGTSSIVGVGGSGVGAQQSLFSKKKSTASRKRKDFSRVLDHGMVFFMKKTTYLSNDYSRKVHDFTSLAETKAKNAVELQARQEKMDRSAKGVDKTFTFHSDDNNHKLVHPMKKHLKPVCEFPLLPNNMDQHWAEAYTHVVFDNAPKVTQLFPSEREISKALPEAFVANVVQRSANEKMTCQVLIPSAASSSSEGANKDYNPLAQYDLDVIPLKESEEAPHTHFSVWIDTNSKEATYLPVPSRVQLSTGRLAKRALQTVQMRRRQYTEEERQELQQLMAQVDEKGEEEKNDNRNEEEEEAAAAKKDDGFGEFDDDDDDEDE